MLNIFDTLKALVAAVSPSGMEEAAAKVITKLASPYAEEIYVDVMGNLIVHKKGPGKKIMLSAHMDEIGMVVTAIDEHGFVRFSNAGGLHTHNLLNIPVTFLNGTRGVIAADGKVAMKDLKLDDLYIDIGAFSREEALKTVRPGDRAVFSGEPFRLGQGLIASPYLDDKIGCTVLLAALSEVKNAKNDLYFVFSVQEELGLRGATTAAYHIAPDYGVSVDVTGCGDTPDFKPKLDMALSKGPAIKVIDRSVVCHTRVIEWLRSAAEAQNIPVQDEILPFGGTDAGAMQLSRGGVYSGGVSICSRYIHSPAEVCSEKDAEDAARLIAYAVNMPLE